MALHNEYACHVPYCYCDHHARAFRLWLARRYGSVEALNEAWGTAFWSQRYGDFAEVMPPRMTPTFVNPARTSIIAVSATTPFWKRRSKSAPP